MRLALSFLLAGTCLSIPGFAAELRLIDAIKDQNRAAVLALIASHADVNALQPDGSTPLAWAAFEDDAAMVAALLKAGAKVNVADEDGETPRTHAAANGHARSTTAPRGASRRGATKTRFPISKVIWIL